MQGRPGRLRQTRSQTRERSYRRRLLCYHRARNPTLGVIIDRDPSIIYIGKSKTPYCRVEPCPDYQYPDRPGVMLRGLDGVHKGMTPLIFSEAGARQLVETILRTIEPT